MHGQQNKKKINTIIEFVLNCSMSVVMVSMAVLIRRIKMGAYIEHL